MIFSSRPHLSYLRLVQNEPVSRELRPSFNKEKDSSNPNIEGDESYSPTTTIDPVSKRPPRYKVILHNDDYTTMEFVILVLEKVFLKGAAEAHQIMMKVHQEGIGICGVYTHEIAEAKVGRVVQMALDHGQPLKCSMEAE